MSGAQEPVKRDVGIWPLEFNLLGAVVTSSYYEIRVAGVLPPEILLDFDRLDASVEPVGTIVHGPLRDQAALQGLLARLETFGIQVLEVRRRYEHDPPPDDDRS
jgi:hypothetical protein